MTELNFRTFTNNGFVDPVEQKTIREKGALIICSRYTNACDVRQCKHKVPHEYEKDCSRAECLCDESAKKVYCKRYKIEK
jgi:hypothetical protein